MQTFLPFPDFEESAYALDQKRLGKQRVETLQIMQALFQVRLVTTITVATDEFRTAYYNLDDEEVDERDLQEGVDYQMRREQIFKTINLPKSQWHTKPLTKAGWLNHPATAMWRGYEWSLLKYQRKICDEWVHNFGFKDTCFAKTAFIFFRHFDPEASHDDPPWLGNVEFHRSHQSNLIRKDPRYYGKQFRKVPADLPYIWPTEITKGA